MLQTLKNYSASEIQIVLSDLASKVLPNASVEEGRKNENVDLKYSDVLAEIRHELKISEDDNSREVINKIQKFLSDEITQSIFKGVDLNTVKSRLGQKGQLSQNLYTFKFADGFKNYEKLGIRRSVVLDALKNPDQYQHLHNERFQDNPDKAVSLFIKHFFFSNQRNNYTLLVKCQRNGFTLVISDSWQVYHSEVDISDAKLPEDILRAFVSVFGEDFTIGEKVGKFFWYEKFSVNWEKETELIKFPNQPNYMTFAQIGEMGDDFIEILHAFSVNLDKYKVNLKSHGVIIA
jgi:hypothetical protein